MYLLSFSRIQGVIELSMHGAGMRKAGFSKNNLDFCTKFIKR